MQIFFLGFPELVEGVPDEDHRVFRSGQGNVIETNVLIDFRVVSPFRKDAVFHDRLVDVETGILLVLKEGEVEFFGKSKAKPRRKGLGAFRDGSLC